MRRTIRPFAVEVRTGRRGAPSWPMLSESAPVHPKIRLPGPIPALTPQQDEPPAPPAWAGARVLMDLTPARPAADELQLSTLIGAEEQQDEPEARLPRLSRIVLSVSLRQSPRWCGSALSWCGSA